MATGDSYKSLSYSLRVADNAISSVVPETCEATVNYERNEIFEHVENRATEKPRRRKRDG